jgi:hypothetical protein
MPAKPKSKAAKAKANAQLRGFATTSIAKKVVQADPEPELPEIEAELPSDAQADTTNVVNPEESQEFSVEDAETHQLNLLADKVKPAASKEINRLHKVRALTCALSQSSSSGQIIEYEVSQLA